MATAGQVANDLELNAKDLRHGGYYEDRERHAASFQRGAETIRALLERVSVLETETEQAGAVPSKPPETMERDGDPIAMFDLTGLVA